MDNNIIGLINLQGPNYMEELSRKRPMASEPFAGKYRLIDFALSTMVNAGGGHGGAAAAFPQPFRPGSCPVREGLEPSPETARSVLSGRWMKPGK